MRWGRRQPHSKLITDNLCVHIRPCSKQAQAESETEAGGSGGGAGPSAGRGGRGGGKKGAGDSLAEKMAGHEQVRRAGANGGCGCRAG